MANVENIQYDEHSNNDNFTLTEVNKLLKELNTTKSPGPDQVHPKVLYESRSVCSSETPDLLTQAQQGQGVSIFPQVAQRIRGDILYMYIFTILNDKNRLYCV
jgi:hypothetical protein